MELPVYIIFFRKHNRKLGDVFMGYHDDTCAAIILHVCQEQRCDDQAISQIEREVGIYSWWEKKVISMSLLILCNYYFFVGTNDWLL